MDNPDETITDSHITRVICLGNPLHGDDGFGFHVWQRLTDLSSSNAVLTDKVEIIDGRTAGLALLPLFKDCERVIVVDVISNTGSPNNALNTGEMLVIRELQEKLEQSNLQFEHGGSLVELIAMLPVYQQSIPHIDFVGVVGENNRFYDQELGATLLAQVNAIADEVCELLFDKQRAH